MRRANQVQAALLLIRSKPDGYTLLVGIAFMMPLLRRWDQQLLHQERYGITPHCPAMTSEQQRI